MHPKVAWVYMCVLAELMGDRRRFRPVTDHLVAHRAIGRRTEVSLAELLLNAPSTRAPPPYFAPFASSTRSDDVQALFVAVAVQNVLPVDIAAVDINKLVAFKQRHQDEFIAFQHHIESLGEALGSAAHVVDAPALQEHLQVLYERET